MRVWAGLKWIFTHPLIVTLFRVALGLVFVVASLDKIVSPAAFAQNIANYRLVPYPWINALAIALPWLEFLVGLLLAAGIWIRETVMIISVLLIVFIVAIGQAIAQGLDISCGCFDTDPAAHKMSRWTLYWDIIWLTWGMLVFGYDRGRFSVARMFSMRGHSPEANTKEA